MNGLWEWLTQPVGTEWIVAAVVFVYVVSGLFGAWVTNKMFHSPDPMERAEVNQIVHRSGVPQPVFVVAGGILWPILFFVGLKNIVTGK